MELLTFLVGALGPSGVLAWYVVYNVKYTIPQIVERHVAERAADAAAYSATILRMADDNRRVSADHKAEVRDTIPEIIKGHNEEMANQAEAHTKAIVKMAEDHKAEIRQLVELFRQDISEERDFRRQEMREVLKRAAVTCPLHGKQDGD